VAEAIPRRFGLDPVSEIQVLTPMQRGTPHKVATRTTVGLVRVLAAGLTPAGPATGRPLRRCVGPSAA
jgi:hypothetical protein